MPPAPHPRRRRKPVPDEAPPKMEPRCASPGCVSPPTPESKYCIVHDAFYGGVKKLQGNGTRAARQGDTISSFLYRVGATLLDAANPVLTNAINKAAQDPAGTAGQAASWAQGATQAAREYVRPAPPPRVDPFEVLGLDRETATEEDVRRQQRALAKAFHVDAGVSSKAAAAKMAEVNAAAAECLKLLKPPAA